MFTVIRSFALPQRGGALLLAAAAFAAGLTAGALIAPVSAGVATPWRRSRRGKPQPASALRSGHPAEVVRVIDGDTFEARVRIWPGMDVTTRVRLRGIDAPEMHARCDDERVKALAARDALARLLAEGSVGISRVGPGQIWRPRRCRRLDRAHAECLRGVVRRRLCAALFRRAARKLVRVKFGAERHATRARHCSTTTGVPTATRR